VDSSSAQKTFNSLVPIRALQVTFRFPANRWQIPNRRSSVGQRGPPAQNPPPTDRPSRSCRTTPGANAIRCQGKSTDTRTTPSTHEPTTCPRDYPADAPSRNGPVATLFTTPETTSTLPIGGGCACKVIED